MPDSEALERPRRDENRALFVTAISKHIFRNSPIMRLERRTGIA